MTRTADRARGTQVLRDANRRNVTDLLRTAGPVSRVEIAERLGLARSAVTAIVAELLDDGVLREVTEPEAQAPTHRPTRGRPRTLVGLDGSAARIVAAQIGARWARVVLADAAGAILATESVDALRATPAQVVGRVADLAQRLAADHDGPPVTNAGICVPGAVDERTGTVLRSDVLGWTDIPLASELRERLQVPVYVQDVTQAATVAEARFGAAIGAADALVVDYGARIGVGLVVDGRLRRGASGLAGSIGHTPEPGNTTPCRCGRTGCLEAVAGVRAMVPAEVLERHGAGGEGAAFAEVVERFRAGEEPESSVVLRALDRGAQALGRVIALTDPEVVVVTGMVAAYPELSGELAERIARAVPAEQQGRVEVRVSTLGLQAWVRGAILVALQQVRPEVRRALAGGGASTR